MSGARGAALLPFALAVFGCQSPSAVEPRTAPATATLPPVAAPPQAPSPEPAPPPTPAKPQLASLLCGDGGVCVVRRDRAAGRDAAGRPLRVVSVYRGVEWSDPSSPPTRPEGGATDLGLEETDTEDRTTATLGYLGCHRFDYWLLTEETPAAPRAERLVTLCNDGHGAAGMGEDTLTVGDNEVTLTISGGSNWRGSRTTEVSLSPLRIRRESADYYWVMGNNRETRSWDAEAFSGLVTWFSPTCQDDGTPPEPDGPGGGSDKDPYAYVPIPAVDFEGDFATAGWKSAALGRCAAGVDGAGRGGFVPFGKPGAAGDASLRVVASRAGELFVEVTDDRWVGASGNWVKDDHLELWLAPELPTYFSHCLENDLPKPRQWGIRVSDGQVFAGLGKPDVKAISVERVAVSGTTVRLKLTLPKGFEAISLVYSDGDDGKTQERLLATSALVHGRVETLGALREVPPERAVCRVEDGKLEPRLAAHGGERGILELE